MAECDLQHAQRVGRIEGLRLIAGAFLHDQVDIRLGQQFGGEIPMLLRHADRQLLPCDVLLTACRHVLRHQHVNAVRLAADMLIDPFQFLLHRFGRVRGRPEHAETACAADGSNNVAAMAEGKQRKFNPQHVADR